MLGLQLYNSPPWPLSICVCISLCVCMYVYIFDFIHFFPQILLNAFNVLGPFRHWRNTSEQTGKIVCTVHSSILFWKQPFKKISFLFILPEISYVCTKPVQPCIFPQNQVT